MMGKTTTKNLSNQYIDSEHIILQFNNMQIKNIPILESFCIFAPSLKAMCV